jgi:hypothetical protein
LQEGQRRDESECEHDEVTFTKKDEKSDKKEKK